MFLGEDTHALDDKGRVVMPRRFRDALGEGCVVAKGEDNQLLVYTPTEYRKRAEAVMEMPQSRTGRRIRRTFFSGADEQQLDKAGRLLVKQELREYAALREGAAVTLLGVYDHIELWNPERHLHDKSAGEEAFTRDEEDDLEDA